MRRIRVSLSAIVVLWAGTAWPIQEVEGVSASGARYEMIAPDAWNGDLVLLLHGYQHPTVANEFPPPQFGTSRLNVIEPLLSEGYAVAYSDYAPAAGWPGNGWAVKEGTEDTHELRGTFQGSFGTPRRVFVIGASMGGLIAMKLVQRHPNLYDGALLLCGAVAGAEATLERVIHVRALFDYYFPGLLPGTVVRGAVSATPAQILAAVQTAWTTDPRRLLRIASFGQAGISFASSAELIQSFVQPLVLHARSMEALIERTGDAGRLPMGNAAIIYSRPLDEGELPEELAADLAALNAGIERVQASVNGARYLQHNYVPEPALSVPVLLFRNARDPVIPSTQQEALAEIIENDENLAVREVPTFGHCAFPPDPPPWKAAFDDLVVWVETGVKP